MEKVEVNKKHVVNRNGKDYVLYAGLLDAAHANGLKGITTKLLAHSTHPTTGAVVFALVHATVTMEHGVYEGIGEVTPGDSKIALGAPVRMAETRAKGRAFRDALNISDFVLEGEDDDLPPPAARPVPAWPKDERTEGLPVRSLGGIIQEAKDRHPELVRPGGAVRMDAVREVLNNPVDPMAATSGVAQDIGDEYRGRNGAKPVVAEYDTDPEKLALAEQAWARLCDEAGPLGVLPPDLDDRTRGHVSLMRGAYQKFQRALREAKAAQIAAEPLPTPDA